MMRFLKELDSFTHESIDSLDNYKKNVFSDDELVVISQILIA